MYSYRKRITKTYFNFNPTNKLKRLPIKTRGVRGRIPQGF